MAIQSTSIVGSYSAHEGRRSKLADGPKPYFYYSTEIEETNNAHSFTFIPAIGRTEAIWVCLLACFESRRTVYEMTLDELDKHS